MISLKDYLVPMGKNGVFFVFFISIDTRFSENCHKVLCPVGVMRLVVPDMEAVATESLHAKNIQPATPLSAKTFSNVVV